MAFEGPFEDQLAIRALNEAYADAVFRRDAEAWGANWAEDSTWHLMGQTFTGRGTIVAVWQSAMADFPFAAFFVQMGRLEIDGDTASGTVYTHENLRTLTGELQRPVGRYTDRYIRIAGRWLFAERNYDMLQGELP